MCEGGTLGGETVVFKSFTGGGGGGYNELNSGGLRKMCWRIELKPLKFSLQEETT